MPVTVGQSPAYGDRPAHEINVVAEREEQRHYHQVTDLLAAESTREREFGALRAVPDSFPKAVLRLDGIEHRNLVDFLIDPLPDGASRASTQ